MWQSAGKGEAVRCWCSLCVEVVQKKGTVWKLPLLIWAERLGAYARRGVWAARHSRVYAHPGHYANKCYTKQKINELIIDEDLRKQLNEILLNPSDSEDNHSLELNNIDGDINSSCSSSNQSSDHEDTCHDCNSKTDYYKAILDMNGLSINVITSEESIILDLLDKIDDLEKKKQVIFKYLHGKQSPPTPNDSKQIPTIGNTFNFSTVMDRLQTIEPKGPTIQDLQGEILSLKRDVKTLSTRISLLELHNIEEVKSEEEEEEIYLNDNNNRLKINPDIINDTKIPSLSKEQEILSIDRVVFQKWYVSIKIVISKDFTFEGIALIDSGADLNCIKEGLVPTKYCETTRQALTTANNGRMKINYKISESWVCNDGICLKTHFIVVRGLSQSIILGTPFLSLLNPMTVDDKGIHSKALDHDICFKFINPLQEQIIHSLKKELIFRQNQICFLNEDLKFQKINRSVEFASKFPDEIREKTQLQRFLGSLNYIADVYQDLYKDTKVLYQRLQKNPQPWTIVHTQAIRRIKLRAKTLPCLCLPLPEAFKIVETDASDIGYGGILKQKVDGKEQLVRFTSGHWNTAQQNYSTIKKEILSIVNCILKFEGDLLNREFLLRIDCKAAKDVLEKDVKNIASKQIFARWQALLSSFDFKIEFIKAEDNSLPDFLTREFLQGK
ncbi:hypothetical protein RJ640_001305 [Escallonia rubra]|uniref:Enzymatic polyprotein n=1 Tax=Escallonia rubra TaxID=112253 RepID=A0AA88U4W6_9ASTE|nr:hypothetical protein RJ640_001305 [Escallonia rubra]